MSGAPSGPDPRFSVVVPAYNSTATIATTVRSVLAQTASDLELLVVDDASTDGTVALVEGYAADDPRIRVVERENGGVSAARNTGIEHARGRYVGFLDHDDAWLPRYLERVGERFAAHDDAGLVYADCWTILDRDKRVHRLTTLEDHSPVDPDAPAERFLEQLLRVNFITASSVTVSRAALDRVGGFSAEAVPSDDWDLWLRIAGAGFRCLGTGGEPLVLLRETATSQSKDPALMARSATATMRRARERLEPGSAARALADARLAELDRELRALERPSAWQRLEAGARAAARPVVRELVHRRAWRPPSPRVRAELEALGELPPTR